MRGTKLCTSVFVSCLFLRCSIFLKKLIKEKNFTIFLSQLNINILFYHSSTPSNTQLLFVLMAASRALVNEDMCQGCDVMGCGVQAASIFIN